MVHARNPNATLPTKTAVHFSVYVNALSVHVCQSIGNTVDSTASLSQNAYLGVGSPSTWGTLCCQTSVMSTLSSFSDPQVFLQSLSQAG
jgi:hypothetical protein